MNALDELKHTLATLYVSEGFNPPLLLSAVVPTRQGLLGACGEDQGSDWESRWLNP
jgi:hypothetical protein